MPCVVRLSSLPAFAFAFTCRVSRRSGLIEVSEGHSLSLESFVLIFKVVRAVGLPCDRLPVENGATDSR